MALQALLSRWSISVTTSDSLADALVIDGSWDVIISDYELGERQNGLDLIEAMRDRASVFALLVASPDESVLQRAADLGVEVIEKPVSPIVLRMFLARSPSKKR
jgi:CheY-like chemotaxis protein